MLVRVGGNIPSFQCIEYIKFLQCHNCCLTWVRRWTCHVQSWWPSACPCLPVGPAMLCFLLRAVLEHILLDWHATLLLTGFFCAATASQRAREGHVSLHLVSTCVHCCPSCHGVPGLARIICCARLNVCSQKSQVTKAPRKYSPEELPAKRVCYSGWFSVNIFSECRAAFQSVLLWVGAL